MERLFFLLPLLGCGPAPEVATPTAPLPVEQIQPQHALSFEAAEADVPWARFRQEGDAHQGAAALHLTASDEYVPLITARAGDVGVDVNGVRLSAWIKADGDPHRLRTVLQCVDATGTTKRCSRIIRPEEITPGRWMELHTQMDLPVPAPPGAQLTVLFWNEGGSMISLDDATITFASTDVPGRTPGHPLDMDSLNAPTPVHP